MMLKRAPWALPILLALAGCGGSNSGPIATAPTVPSGHIAYVQEGQIVPEGAQSAATDVFIRRADGSGLTLLSADSGQPFNFDPAIAPDGRRVAFIASGVGRSRQGIYVVNADGTGLRRVFEAAAFIRSLSWTPDGANLIYVAAGIADGDTIGKNLIYRIGVDGADATPQLVFGDDIARREPAISPDGRTLAYLLDERDEPGAGEIFTMSLDGAGRATGAPRQLTSDGLFIGSLQFAPSGKRLYYAFIPPSNYASAQFNGVNLDGTPAPGLSISTYNPVGYSFSPNGQYIAFGSNSFDPGSNEPVSASRILILRADGSGEPRVLSGDEEGNSQFSPSWSR